MEEDSDVEDNDSEGETYIADDNIESDVGQVERIYFDYVEVTDDQAKIILVMIRRLKMSMIKEKLTNKNWKKRKYFKTKP